MRVNANTKLQSCHCEERSDMATQGRFRMRKKSKLHVKNKTEPVMCYDVLR